jgi:carbamoyltransferase
LAAYVNHNAVRPPAHVKSAYLGPAFTDGEVLQELQRYDDISYRQLALDNVPLETAQLIVDGQVVGWFQGRMEWGPRALGNRSVLADPRDPRMRDRINDRLKKRDWFMPFAPSVLKEYCDECFINYHPSPYMNLAFDMRPPYDELVPAIMHVDKTARPQEVDRTVNAPYYDTIEAFRQLTGIPMVLNTSFNRHGLPIVCTPEDAVNHLRWGCIDMLAIGTFLVQRTGPIVPFSRQGQT